MFAVAISIACQQAQGEESTVGKSGPKSFEALYQAVKGSNRKSALLESQADVAAKQGRFAESAAKYLAGAAEPFLKHDFERARPDLDKAFFFAEKMGPDDQKQFLMQLSNLVANANRLDDSEVYKYLAQHRLRLMRLAKDSTADERYNEVQTLAFSCSSNKRFKEAETLLLETLADLQRTKPPSENIGWCLYTLGRVYEDSGDIGAAVQYYKRWIDFAKNTPDKRNYHRSLQEFASFLIKHKLDKELVLVAQDLYDEIERTGDRDRMPLLTYARGLSELAPGLSYKYYRLGFEVEKSETKHAMNIGYGSTVAEWAESLHKNGQTQEAISVLQEGMAFCRTSPWPDALDRNMPQMLKKCVEYMRASNREADANQLQSSFDNEMKARKDRAALNRDQELQNILNNPTAPPPEKVSALTSLAYRAFDNGQCDTAEKYLTTALETYDNNAMSKDSERMYNCFTGLTARLNKCGRNSSVRPTLLRIIRARMQSGFTDPAHQTRWSYHGGPTRLAFEEYCGAGFGASIASLNELLDEARKSGNKSNVLFVLEHLFHAYSVRKEALDVLEQIIRLRADDEKTVQFTYLMRATDWAQALNEDDKAMKYFREAEKISDTPILQGGRTQFQTAGSFYNLGYALQGKNKLLYASEVLLVAYRRSLREERDGVMSYQHEPLVGQAEKYLKQKDAATGAKFLKSILDVTKSERGPDNLLTREWLMKLSEYYLKTGNKVAAKLYYSELVGSLFRPGMSVSPATIEEMTKYAAALTKYGCTGEAVKIESKLDELEKQHCAAH